MSEVWKFELAEVDFVSKEIWEQTRQTMQRAYETAIEQAVRRGQPAVSKLEITGTSGTPKVWSFNVAVPDDLSRVRARNAWVGWDDAEIAAELEAPSLCCVCGLPNCNDAHGDR